ncbi:MAG: hypothetical protein K8W52_46110 [Deltaproteobacteria bacterium]|nr:hypothetical protein [Deltaproteobacteria bacterium]
MRRRHEWITAAVASLALASCATKDKLYCETDQDCSDNPGRPYCDVAGVYPESEGIGKTCIASPFDAGVPDPVDAAVDAPPIDAPWDGRPDATPPPDGPPADAAPCKRKIAFVSNRTGNNEIFVMNEDGSDPTNITNSAASDSGPIWSPDGNWIAFRSDRGGSNQYYVMDASGGTPVQISTCTNRVASITWRSDNAYLAYECQPTLSYESDIYKVLRTGALPVNLTASVVGANSNPSFSPDGQWITFTSLRPGTTADFDIYKMDFSGANVTRLTTDPSKDRNPRWSPTGISILYTSRENGTTPYDYPNLYTMKADGTSQVAIHAPDVWTAVWSPDGAKIACEDDPGTPTQTIVVMSASGANPITLSNPQVASSGPTWAPAGDRVGFSTAVGTETHVAVSNTNGTGYVDLTPTANGSQPAWQPVCH